MNKIPFLFLILMFAGMVSADGGIISFNKVYLDTAGKLSFTYPTALPNPKALQELQKNFIKQKFGGKISAQDPLEALKLYGSQYEELEYLSDAVSFPMPGIVQFVTSYYVQHSGVAHGVSGFDVGIYKISDGKKIELSSLFNKNWKNHVTGLIVKEFLSSQNLLSLADYAYTQKESDFIPVNVKISEDGGLDFVYPAYKIAPYAAGDQTVFLSWNVLKPYLNKRSAIYQRLQF